MPQERQKITYFLEDNSIRLVSYIIKCNNVYSRYCETIWGVIWVVINWLYIISWIRWLIKPFSVVAGDITQKGYEKKRTRLLQQYASKQIGECFAFLEFIKTPASKRRAISSRINRDMRYRAVREVSDVKIFYYYRPTRLVTYSIDRA